MLEIKLGNPAFNIAHTNNFIQYLFWNISEANLNRADR